MRRKRLHPLVSSVWKFNAALAAAYLAVVAGGLGGLSSILDYKDVKASPFDGMVYPVQYVPNWLKSGVWTVKTQFSEISASDLVETPKYDAKLLAVVAPDDAKALFARYTYITPYMGAYMDDARKEYAGSHLAVDVRAALGTPIHAIANGVVVRTKEDAGGDGMYVVVRHDAVPYNGQSLQMFSSYLHVADVGVKPGQIVRKGDVIAHVGMTGITTTPHLHFQLDRANAPFSPYWPFTFAEAKKAGFDMFSAVNAGFGAQGALAYTYNPFDVISQNLDYVPSAAPSVVVVPSVLPKPVVTVANPAPVTAASSAKPAVDPVLLAAASSAFGGTSTPSAPATPAVPAVLAPAQSQVLQQIKESVVVPDVRDVATIPVSVPSPQPVPTVSKPVSTVALAAIDVFSSAPAHPPVASLKVTQKHGVSAGVAFVTLTAYDDLGRPTSAPVFGDVKVLFMKADLVVSEAAITSDAFSNGVASVQAPFGVVVPDFVKADGAGLLATADLTGLEVASVKPAVVPAAASSAKPTFKDVPTSSIYSESVEALYVRGVVKGVSKTKFAPSNSVTRAEALAIVMRALGIQVDAKATVRMKDVSSKHWVQPYLAKAVELGAVAPGRTSFGPNIAVTRSEIAALLFALGRIPTTDLYTAKVTDVASGAWYEKFAKTAVQFGVMKAFGGKFRPTARISRGDVAAAVWNFLKKFPVSPASA